MFHFNLTAKIWLSFGIFLVGFVFLTSVQNQQGLTTERRLKESSEILFPAAQESQSAYAFFQRMHQNFGNAVMRQDWNSLARAHENFLAVIASLRRLSALRPAPAERGREATRLAEAIEQLVRDAEMTYAPAIVSREGLTPQVQDHMRELAANMEANRRALQRLQEQVTADLHQQLSVLRARSVKLRKVGWIVFATTLLVSSLLVGLTIRHGIIAPLRRAEVALAQERESLRTSEAWLRLLFQTIPHAVWVSDPETDQFLLVNDAATRQYGYTFEEFDRLHVFELLAPEESARRRDGDLPAGAWKHRAKDGRLLNVEVNARSFEFQGRRAVLALSQDVTERIKLQTELQHAQRLESVGQLAAGIAHEINTPIQYVGDNIRFLCDAFEAREKVFARYEELRIAAEQQDFAPATVARLRAAMEEVDLAYINEEIPRATSQSLAGVERVATIVRAMKEFAHPGSKEKAAADLNKALTNALIVSRNELKYVAEIETNFGELPPVICHIAELNQVFLNLLVNAADAIREVVKKTNQKGRIRVSTRRDGDQAIVSISDTGGGIPEEIRNRVFDPFFTTKEVGRGSGQGLAIARATVVEKHGGNIWFEPNEGGTTFLVSLPIEPTPALTPDEEELYVSG